MGLSGGDLDRIQNAIERALTIDRVDLCRSADQVLFRYFKADNDQQSSPSMNVNGSSTPINFEVGFPYEWLLFRINIIIHDSAITTNTFGGLPALTNGLRILAVDANDNELQDFKDGQTIKANRDWVPLAGVDVYTVGDMLAIRWTIAKAGSPIWFDGGGKMRVIVQDNLSGLDFFEMMAQGIRLP